MSVGTGAQAHSDDEGAAAVTRAGEGKELSVGEERSALDYLLGAPQPARYKVTVKYETPAGMRDLVFHFRALDGSVIDKIEQSHIGADGMMDKTAADFELVAKAVEEIEDPESGVKVAPRSERFRTIKDGETPLASSIDALKARFGTQGGLIAGVSRGVREAGGWNQERVGKAARVLVAAAGN